MTTKQKQEYLAWLRQPADTYGECDRCHKDRPLYRLPMEIDDEPDAGWVYCPSCFRWIVNKI